MQHDKGGPLPEEDNSGSFSDLLHRVLAKEGKCTGCGICENNRPVDGGAAIVVYSSDVLKKLKPEPNSTQNSKS